jgi:hypothetical protein
MGKLTLETKPKTPRSLLYDWGLLNTRPRPTRCIVGEAGSQGEVYRANHAAYSVAVPRKMAPLDLQTETFVPALISLFSGRSDMCMWGSVTHLCA